MFLPTEHELPYIIRQLPCREKRCPDEGVSGRTSGSEQQQAARESPWEEASLQPLTLGSRPSRSLGKAASSEEMRMP